MRLFPLSSSLSSEREQNSEKKSRAMVYLNVYDLTPINNYLYLFGLGIFHSGIEVHGMEYGFGAHDYPSSGVFEVEPRSCPGFIYRRSVLLGGTDILPTAYWKAYAAWVNRMARVGSFCNCLLPESLQVAAVRHLPERLTYADDEGSESGLSASIESEEEEPNHHLLTASNGDVAFLKEKPVRLARELI
ncbi:hypothetical protein K1719_017981 [Acacia pycnantha]|nr:hypothetical protein K1719_017981 [Acacia pycnantha]